MISKDVSGLIAKFVNPVECGSVIWRNLYYRRKKLTASNVMKICDKLEKEN